MFLKSTVLTVEQVYGGQWQLNLPWFQRAYAWNDGHVGGLLQDLIEAMRGPRKRYSLGHMSLARANGATHASLVDGHQRSISLTMLIAILRDVVKDEALANRLHRLIEGDNGAFRLIPQPAVAEFFAAHVQRRGATLIDPPGDIVDLSPSAGNMLRNRDHLRSLLGKKMRGANQIALLAVFVMEKCLIVVDEVEDEEEARDLLARAEDRGLDPHSSEISKVTIVSAMPPEEREAAGRLFEQAQSLMSAEHFGNLLDHIRVLKVRKRRTGDSDGELSQLFRLNVTGLPFLNDELLPRARTMARLIAPAMWPGGPNSGIGRCLTTLSWVGNQYWVPPALHWLGIKGDAHPDSELFFARLERLAFILRIAAEDPTDQERRHIEVLGAIDSGVPVDRMEPLIIEPELLAEALDNLRSRTFFAKRFSALVLRRVSINIEDGRDPGPVDGDAVTVEHILPRKPSPSWRKNFPTEADVLEYCNRLGNLAFLSKPDNNRAGNNDFMVKRFLLAQSGTRFTLSLDAKRAEDWDGKTILERSERLIAALLAPWQLTA